MKVRATKLGFYNHARRREGDVFVIADEPKRKVRKVEEREFEEIENDDGTKRKILKRRFRPDSPMVIAMADKEGMIPEAFSSLWMEPVAEVVPEKISTAQQEINRKTDEIKATNQAKRGEATGSAEVI